MIALNLLLVSEAMLLHRKVTAAAAHPGLAQSQIESLIVTLKREEPHWESMYHAAIRVPTSGSLWIARNTIHKASARSTR